MKENEILISANRENYTLKRLRTINMNTRWPSIYHIKIPWRFLDFPDYFL